MNQPNECVDFVHESLAATLAGHCHGKRFPYLASRTLSVMTNASRPLPVIGRSLAKVRGQLGKHISKQVDRLLSNQDVIATAVQAGSSLHASLQYNENGGVSSFYTEITAMRVAVGQSQAGSQYVNYASGLLDLLPPITPQEQATYGVGAKVASLDTLGNYFYGTLGGTVLQYSCYVTTWWAN